MTNHPGNAPVEQWDIGLPTDDGEYEIDIIDTWNMTITPAQPGSLPVSPATRGGVAQREAAFGVELPSNAHMALKVQRKQRWSQIFPLLLSLSICGEKRQNICGRAYEAGI